MQFSSQQTEPEKNSPQGVVYRTVCQNPGCAQFDLTITAKNASLLSAPMPCPRCQRRGGMLKSLGRIGDKGIWGQAGVSADRGRVRRGATTTELGLLIPG